MTRSTSNSNSGSVSKLESFLLVKLMEECAEVTQACSKILEHGFTAKSRETGIFYDNQKQLAKELGDVIAAMHVLCESVRVRVRNEALNHRAIEEHAANKRAILRVLAGKRNTKQQDA